MTRVRAAVVMAVVLALTITSVLAWRAWQQRKVEAERRAQVQLWATVQQWRADELSHTLRVAVRNDGPLPVEVTRLEFDAPSFDGLGPVEVKVRVPVGGHRLDIQIPYGDGICPAGGSTAAHVNLQVRTADGQLRRIRLALPHPNQLLDLLLKRECQRQLIAQVATVGFGEWTQQPDGSLKATLVVERTDRSDPVTVYDVAGSVLYRITPDPADRAKPLTTMATGVDRLELPLLVDMNRCTGHALGDASKPFSFAVWLAVGEGDYIYSTITVSPDNERVLRELANRRCQGELRDK